MRRRIFEGEVADIRAVLPDCPEALADFFDVALARDWTARPASARELRERLEDVRARLS